MQSMLARELVAEAYFWDAYRARLLQARDAGLVELFFAIFGHYPAWLKAVLIARNRLARLVGLEAPTTSDILHLGPNGPYRVGDTIGVWPIFALTDTELVAGRNNKHLDFRLSILRSLDPCGPVITVSTVCTTHNLFGKIYLTLIIPFHKWGVKQLMLRALAAGRL